MTKQYQKGYRRKNQTAEFLNKHFINKHTAELQIINNFNKITKEMKKFKAHQYVYM